MNPNCGGNVLAHELGHNIGLFHTHESPKEFVDGSNCIQAGDRVCDTNADPNIQGNIAYLVLVVTSNKEK